MRRAPRSASRQLALQVLYAVDLAAARSQGEPDVMAVFSSVAANFDLPEGARAFAEELVCGVAEKRESLDEHIGRCARNWRVERMAAVDRNVLRLAAFELGRGEVPASVIIDQAIELARRFGDDPSPAFVNGVLDAVARELGCVEPVKEIL
ncbi:MAG: transcription antitermination factor NusB [Deltaproteobacteria bacterium]|nr:transcription antitermination factor NusB [Deltaproteobacteria bacterium]MBW2360381.1 transcription antitermination factor NusB [Deltaproteobacteria bacterium]